MIELCVFDMDGLLLDTERYVYLENGLRASEAIGHPVTAGFLTGIMGGDWKDYKRRFLEEYGEDYPFEEYWEVFWPIVRHLINETAIPLRPGAREILDYCKDSGITMALATSSLFNTTENCLRNSDIARYFSYVVTGDMVSHSKPDPEIFLKVIDHFGIDKEHVLILEDGHNGAQAAINGGCRFVLVEDVAHLSEEDKTKAQLHTDSLFRVIDFIRKENEGTSGV